jgi:glycyl-tRNA synthetase beta chain
VADAIAQHYQPLGPGDTCPSAPVSICVALADKIDTLVGFWMIDEKPTGSKDPYALRRAALGVIRLIVENKLRLPLTKVFAAAQGEYTGLSASDISGDLLDFFGERLKVVLRDQGMRHDLITAVMATGAEDDLVRLLARVEALRSFLETDDGSNLLVAYRRAANIVRIEEKKDKRAYDGGVAAAALQQPEEKTLFSHLGDASKGAQIALGSEDFTAAMAAIAQLRQPVDAFFDHVTVNAEAADLRENRLQLLSAIGATLAEVADFSKIEG